MNNNIQNDSNLQHHGIRGQRWGVRRTDSQLARGGKSNSSSKKASTKEAEGSKVKSMSDAELRQRINRIQMEKQYKDLTSSEISAGRKFVNDVLGQSGKKVATAVITGATLYTIKSATSGEFNIAELGNYMTPKPKSK